MHYHDLAESSLVAQCCTHTHTTSVDCSSLGLRRHLWQKAMAPDVEVTRYLQGDGVNRQLLLASIAAGDHM